MDRKRNREARRRERERAVDNYLTICKYYILNREFIYTCV